MKFSSFVLATPQILRATCPAPAILNIFINLESSLGLGHSVLTIKASNYITHWLWNNWDWRHCSKFALLDICSEVGMDLLRGITWNRFAAQTSILTKMNQNSFLWDDLDKDN